MTNPSDHTPLFRHSDLNAANDDGFHLFFRIGTGGFTCLITDRAKHQVRLFHTASLISEESQESPTAFTKFIRENQINLLSFHSVRGILFIREATLVPDDLYMESEATAILRLNTGISNAGLQTLIKKVNPGADAYCIMAIPPGITDLAAIFKTSVEFYHPFGVNFKDYHSKPADASIRNSLSLFCESRQVFIQVHHYDSLVFHNFFDIKIREEFQYYLAALLNTLDIKTNDVSIALGGDISDGHFIIEEIRKTGMPFEFMKPASSMDLSNISTVRSSAVADLLHLMSCE
jgi:hypothetical protein